MRADHGAGALAIQVKIANVEEAAGPFEPCPIQRIDGSGEAVVAIVDQFQSVVEVARSGDRKHGSEDLFLEDAGLAIDIGDDGGLDEVSVAGSAAAGEQAAFRFASSI